MSYFCGFFWSPFDFRGNWFALAGVALAVVIVNTATKENEVIAPVEKGVFCFAGESARV